ncbi:MAG TPA: DUF5107 domain-containing protein [Bacteroides sp.]|mgnify:CR=1 FL=1|nr:DUF5107 domain-containing protein [Bacteroides sp.]
MNAFNLKVMRHIRLCLSLAILTGITGSLCAQVRLTETEWILPSYTVAPPDKNPMFFDGRSYQGASKVIYPYGMNDVIGTEKSDRAWKALVLENEYIRLCVTPEIGGKLYYATDLGNGYNFIYKNDVVKPSNIGMLGAWVSGGIEWCVLHHHRASSFLPVDYELVENEDGSKTIWIGETEPRQRMRWTIGITAFPGKSYFEAMIKIHNPTPLTHSFLYWANVAVHTNKDYQVIFPPSVQVATYHAKNDFTHWPVSREVYRGQDFTEGVDVSWWVNSPGSASFFAHDLKEDFMGGYDHGKETGTVHIGDHHIVKGAKLWEWGSGPRGQATEARLTENAGPYVEIMTGAYSDNQPDYSWIKPYETKIIRQYWYPVRDIGGFKNANLNGAVNLEEREGNRIFLGYHSTQEIDRARIVLKNRGRVIFEKIVRISPESAFTELIKSGAAFKLTDLYTEMTDAGTGEILVSYQPVEMDYPEELPETVEPPPPPGDIANNEELYLTGRRIEQFHNPRIDPMDYYVEVLRRDPLDIRTNISVGNILLKNGDYLNARKHFSNAITRLAKDYTRPSDCEALYLQGITLRALGLFDEAVDTLHRAAWDYAFHAPAYLELARISAAKGDYAKSLAEINISLSTNAMNNSAICFRAAMQRKMGDYSEAEKTLETILKEDPLDFRAANEAYLLARERGDNQEAGRRLDILAGNMRDFEQNYLELAAGYLNDGLPGEAEDVLLRFKGEYPIVSYYLGYLAHRKGNREEAGKYFIAASRLPEDYCFPFRLETIRVLETALEYDPTDGKAYYYLGNILYDKQPEKAIGCWEKAVEHAPGLSIAYRNLGWGYYRCLEDGHRAIAAYEKAIGLNKEEPVYFEELDALYETSNAPIEKRLRLFEGNNEVVSRRDDAFARQIAVLTLAGKAERAVEYLAGRQFSYREGSSRVRDIIIDAYLVLGMLQLEEKDYDKAVETLLKAQLPEEEASGSRSGNRNIQVNYYLGLAYEAGGKQALAKKMYTSCTEMESARSGYISYYQGMGNLKLGRKKEAAEIFSSLVAEGEEQIRRANSSEVDFFAKFGAQEAENARLSDAYVLKGLGNNGLGDTGQALENLKKAVELSTGNLNAVIALSEVTTP